MKSIALGVKEASFGIKPLSLVKKTSKSGKKYEHKVSIRFIKKFEPLGWAIMKSPWIEFVDSKNKKKTCEFDLLMVHETTKQVCLIEIKSWEYVAGLRDIKYTYAPIVELMYPDYHFESIIANQKKGCGLNKILLDKSNPYGEVTLLKVR